MSRCRTGQGHTSPRSHSRLSPAQKVFAKIFMSRACVAILSLLLHDQSICLKRLIFRVMVAIEATKGGI